MDGETFARLRVGGRKNLHNIVKRDQRRSFGVAAYVGANGGGKTTCMVWDALPSLEEGRPALSTVRLQDYQNPRPCDDDYCASNPEVLDHDRMRPTAEGRLAMIRNQKRLFLDPQSTDLEEVEMASAGVHLAAHPLWIPWTGWQQLLDLKFGEVLADEMTGIAEARSAMSLPTVVLNQFQQLRRDDIPFRYTLPSWDQADVSLRRPTQVVTLCSGRWKVDAPADGDLKRVWRSNRLFRWKTYQAMLLTELTEGKRSELTPDVADWHWGPTSTVQIAYDTFAPVLRVGVVGESGRCHRCGGSRKAPVCACGPAAEPRGAGARARRTGAAGAPGHEVEDAPPAPGRRVARTPARIAGRTPAQPVASVVAECDHLGDTPPTVLAAVDAS